MSDKKLALVTGASRGIGHQIAIGLADNGHQVIAVSRTALASAIASFNRLFMSSPLIKFGNKIIGNLNR